MSLHILHPGTYTLPVDAGRPGHRSRGVPTGGAADRFTYRLANALVGNPTDAVALEITLAGPTIQVDRRLVVVVAGIDFPIEIVGRGTIRSGFTFLLEPGEILRIGATPTGVRAYLAVAGGLQTSTILGSRSAFDPVVAGDLFPVGDGPHPPVGRGLHFAYLRQTDPIRVVDGTQHDWFLDNAFYEQAYTVSRSSNRMGLRLEGEPLQRRPGEMVSEAVAPGSIQVAHDGKPIILGVDGQTIGGYPKIAQVIRADLDRLARLRPGATVHFQQVTLPEAEAIARSAADELRTWQTRLALA